MKTKHRPIYAECGCCGHWHSRDLPGYVDCRDDRHRFTSDQLDAKYGATGWEEITIEDQEKALEDGGAA